MSMLVHPCSLSSVLNNNGTNMPSLGPFWFAVSRVPGRRRGTKYQPNHADGSFPKEKNDEKRARYSLQHEAEEPPHRLQKNHEEPYVAKQRFLDSTSGGKEQHCQPHPKANKDGPVFVEAVQSIEREAVNKGGLLCGKYSINRNDQKR